MRIKIILVLPFSLLAFLYWGATVGFAQATPKKGGTITVGLNTDVVGLDPHATTADVVSLVLNHVYEPLLAHGENWDLRPCLAERYEMSKNQQEITFYLRKGKLFHTGREMVADDVKYSLERFLKVSPRRELLETVSRIEAVDKYTVRVHLKQPDVSILYSLGGTSPVIGIVPKEEVEKEGGKISHPVGTGPFLFREWKPDRYLILERFDKYRSTPGPAGGYAGERIAYLDRIKFIPIPEESVATMALLNKEVDFLQYIPFKDVEKFRNEYSKRGILLASIPGQSWYQIFFGCNQPVTKNLKFRQACAYAIDREAVMQAAIRGYGVVNPSFVPTKSEYYTPFHKKWYPKDIKKAKQLLQESGYKGEEVEIVTNKKYLQMYTIAVLVQSQLAGIGVNTKLNVVEWAVEIQKRNKGDYQILSYGIGPRPDPPRAYYYVKDNGFEDLYPRMKEIMTAANRTLDFETRKRLFEEAHALTIEGVPSILFYHYDYINAYRDYVKGYKAWSSQPYFWGVWLDK